MVKSDRALRDLLNMAIVVVAAVLVNQLASFYFFRVDLTEEKRYTIKQATRELLGELDDNVFVEVYLEGDLNAGFRRLQKGVREILEEFRIHSRGKLQYVFTDPAQAKGQQAQQEFMASLVSRGIQPMNVIDNKDGQRTEKLVFPGAIVSYGGAEAGVMLLKDKWSQNAQEKLNQSVEGVEYELASAIQRLSTNRVPRVGILKGHGEPDSVRLAGLWQNLATNYAVTSVALSNKKKLRETEVLLITKPTRAFTEHEKFELDQFILGGGKALFFLDQLEASADSASNENYFAFPYGINLDDLLFRYGVRVNADLVQDRVCLRYPVVTNVLNGSPQITPLEWPFFPLVNHFADHPATRNLDAVFLKFASSVDTVKATGVRKTPLLMTSAYARKLNTPVKVNINGVRQEMTPEKFSEGPVALGYLLEGEFTSLYRNRFLPQGVDSTGFRTTGRSSIVVIGDGDLVLNELTRTGRPQPLGLDSFSRYTFGNGELVNNLVAWLTDDSGLISARTRQVSIRPLDKEKIQNDRRYWQVVNIGLPLVLIVAAGFFKSYVRKKTYSKS